MEIDHFFGDYLAIHDESGEIIAILTVCECPNSDLVDAFGGKYAINPTALATVIEMPRN